MESLGMGKALLEFRLDDDEVSPAYSVSLTDIATEDLYRRCDEAFKKSARLIKAIEAEHPTGKPEQDKFIKATARLNLSKIERQIIEACVGKAGYLKALDWVSVVREGRARQKPQDLVMAMFPLFAYLLEQVAAQAMVTRKATQRLEVTAEQLRHYMPADALKAALDAPADDVDA